MKPDRASATADGAAALRAYHLLREPPYVFEDRLAFKLTRRSYRVMLSIPPVRWVMLDLLRPAMVGVRAQVLSRARYAEEELVKAVASGVRQYVIISAGLDSFAWRRGDLIGRLRVFELDHPATQAVKRARLRRAGLKVPDNLSLLPADLERQTVEDVLRGSAFDTQKPAFFSWLGTVAYLTVDAVRTTLEGIRAIAFHGSQVVLDHVVPISCVPDTDRAAVNSLLAVVARRGEPVRTYLTPPDVGALIQQCGFEVLEQVSPEMQEQRYFSGRTDGLRPLRYTWLVKAGVRKS